MQMKKIKGFFEEYFKHVVYGALTVLISLAFAFIKDYSNRFFSLPEKVDHINNLRKGDSLKAIYYIHELDSIKTILISQHGKP